MNTDTCDYIPFCYLIGWTKHNKWYYGARWKKGWHGDKCKEKK